MLHADVDGVLWAAGNIIPPEAQQNGFRFDLALETNHV